MSWYHGAVVVVLGVGAYGAWWYVVVQALRKRSQVKKTERWLVTEATIEAGEFRKFSQARGGSYRLAVFTFSYQIGGQGYSGKFSLFPYITDPGESICTRMIGRKLQVRYDPAHPEKWYIVEKLIEGCKVMQKMDPHFLNVVPAD